MMFPRWFSSDASAGIRHARERVERLEAKATGGSERALQRLAQMADDEIGVARRKFAHDAVERVKTRTLLDIVNGQTDFKLYNRGALKC